MAATSLWHMPQVSGADWRKAADFGEISSWALPWHTPQSGAPVLPWAAACPWVAVDGAPYVRSVASG